MEAYWNRSKYRQNTSWADCGIYRNSEVKIKILIVGLKFCCRSEIPKLVFLQLERKYRRCSPCNRERRMGIRGAILGRTEKEAFKTVAELSVYCAESLTRAKF